MAGADLQADAGRWLLAGGQYLQCDETPVKFIDPDEKGRGARRPRVSLGRQQTRPGDDQFFDWRLSRRHGELTSLLGDGYVEDPPCSRTATPCLRRVCPGRIPRSPGSGCWRGHAEAKLFEAERESPRVAKAALRFIGRMYLKERAWLYECEALWD